MDAADRGLAKRSHHDSDNFMDIPIEVFSKILMMLPASDLHSCKFVSKSWCSLISHPNFVNAHYNRYQSQHGKEILFETISDPSKGTDFVYSQFRAKISQTSTPSSKELQPATQQHKHKAFSLKASCDGLLVFQDKYYFRHFYVSNPATFRLEPLPVLSLSCSNLALVRVQNRYNVFAIQHDLFAVLPLWEKPLCWQYHGPSQPSRSPDQQVLSNLILVDKELHWLTTDLDLTLNKRQCYFIFSVHVEKHSFTKAKIPLQLCHRQMSQLAICKGLHLLSELQGSLCLTFLSHYQLQMFVLEDRVNSVWIKLRTVHLQSLSKQHQPFRTFLSQDMCFVSMKGVDRDNLDDLIQILVHQEDQLLLYDFRSQKSRLVGSLSKEQKLCRSCYFHFDTLISWSSPPR